MLCEKEDGDGQCESLLKCNLGPVELLYSDGPVRMGACCAGKAELQGRGGLSRKLCVRSLIIRVCGERKNG